MLATFLIFWSLTCFKRASSIFRLFWASSSKRRFSSSIFLLLSAFRMTFFLSVLRATAFETTFWAPFCGSLFINLLRFSRVSVVKTRKDSATFFVILFLAALAFLLFEPSFSASLRTSSIGSLWSLILKLPRSFAVISETLLSFASAFLINFSSATFCAAVFAFTRPLIGVTFTWGTLSCLRYTSFLVCGMVAFLT